MNAITQAWQSLREAADQHRPRTIVELFDAEPQRAERLALEAGGLHLDFSRQRLPLAVLPQLLNLAQATGLTTQRDAMFSGERINRTENRAVLHTALRRDPSRPLMVEGRDVTADVSQALASMRAFCDAVREGRWRGATGRPIEHVVSVGIGGSALGPVLALDALRERAHPRLQVHFLSNVDPRAWTDLQPRLDPTTTLVVIASKSWKTIETALNASAVREWLLAAGIGQAGLRHHLVGVSANVEGAVAFGLAPEGVFPFWDWVGGRYSLWSAIGLPVMLGVGPMAFGEMLEGARAMDDHFAGAPLERNAPVLMALLSLWNGLLLGSGTEVVVPYSDPLARLPAYLQQLQMESNGKAVDIDGQPLPYASSPVTWGEPGTDAQHSFFQLLHQGTAIHPVDFIGVVPQVRDAQGRDLVLMANYVAQIEALTRGRSFDEVVAGLKADGIDDAEARLQAPHRVHPGNRPSTSILLDALTPARFGALLALYEHKTAALGWLLRINSFDQWGVELGKRIALQVEPMLSSAPGTPVPSRTIAGLVERLRAALAAR